MPTYKVIVRCELEVEVDALSNEDADQAAEDEVYDAGFGVNTFTILSVEEL